MTDTYYIDCEFDGHNGPLISMALVREDVRHLYVMTPHDPADPWVIQNVMPVLNADRATRRAFLPPHMVSRCVREFIGAPDRVRFVADSVVDIGRLCQALSTDDEGNWRSCELPRIDFTVVNIDCYPTTLPNAVQHNAWWDAMALREAVQNSKAL